MEEKKAFGVGSNGFTHGLDFFFNINLFILIGD